MSTFFSPRGNREIISKIFENLSAEITYFERKGCVILQRDLNAHVRNESDVLMQDKFDNDFSSDNILSLPPRTSEDSTKVDGRGEELLDLCKAFNLVIINGRKTGDPFGKITSYQWNGKSVVDYAISSSDIFTDITFFKVGNYSPWISDHCPLFFEIHKRGNYDLKKNGSQFEKAPDHFYFRDVDKETFLNTLKSPEFTSKFQEFLSHSTDNMNPQKLVSNITNTLMNACTSAGIKPRKRPKTNHSPWFDEECQKLKRSIKKKCRKLRNKYSDSLKFEIFKQNRMLKTTTNGKKKECKSKILSEMKLKKADQKLFWKLLDKLDTPRNNDIFKNNIPHRKWNNHSLQEYFQ